MMLWAEENGLKAIQREGKTFLPPHKPSDHLWVSLDLCQQYGQLKSKERKGEELVEGEGEGF